MHIHTYLLIHIYTYKYMYIYRLLDQEGKAFANTLQR